MSDEIVLPAGSQKILDEVKKLSILELADLVKAMEKEFGVSAAAPVAAAGAAGVVAEVKDTFSVELTAAGGQKINVIKVVREITALGLKEAKDLVDGAPKMVKENIKKPEADEMKKKLEAAGATVTIK